MVLKTQLVQNHSKQFFASKYKLFLPTEEELRRELEQQKHQIELEIKLNKKK